MELADLALARERGQWQRAEGIVTIYGDKCDDTLEKALLLIGLIIVFLGSDILGDGPTTAFVTAYEFRLCDDDEFRLCDSILVPSL
ncbi:hypothetical protein SO802_008869 [Lithocarpus litseifolius]|uniref:Uncharacterized protein n=1 Tax=Lithocarpus litseifolius TaxID=425828 RepID=A0AAW2DBZ9_9ROSI